jgi:hypothetical protein
MTEVEKHVLWLFLEVAGLLVVLASMDGLITLLRWIVGRSQRRVDHRRFVEQFRSVETHEPSAYQPRMSIRKEADPFGYDEMPPMTTLTANHPTTRYADALDTDKWGYTESQELGIRVPYLKRWDGPKEADQIVIEARKGPR